MLRWIWGILLCSGIAALTFYHSGDAAVDAMLTGAGEAVSLSISLAGAYMLWMGILEIANRAGLIRALSNALRRPCQWLFPNAGEAAGPLTLNIAANMLGMGNAATPFGLEAMRLLQKHNPDKVTATDAMCTFLAVNASALQLVPTTLIGLRAAAGSLQPAAIVVPSFLASFAATLVAVIACRLCMRRT